jgi:hypothetical protein
VAASENARDGPRATAAIVLPHYGRRHSGQQALTPLSDESESGPKPTAPLREVAFGAATRSSLEPE